MSKYVTYGVLLFATLLAGFVAGKHRATGSIAAVRQPLYYVDSMHPGYRSDRPGKAPDCGMELTPVYPEDLAQSSFATETSPGNIRSFDPATLKTYGIQVETVTRGTGEQAVRLFGRVAIDDTRIYRVNMGTDGYVKETHGDAVGDHVNKDQHLATIYSPEFLSLAGGYLSANERAPTVNSANSGANANTASAVARADRLRNLGMSDAQIKELSTTRKIPEDVYLVAPTDGFIIARNIASGLRFERHTDLYTVADLRHVWILAQVTAKDTEALRPGSTAQVTVPDTGASFKARVSNVLPQVDPASHVLTLRLEADNPGYKLRPNMFVNVLMPIKHGLSLTVASDAIVDSGLSKQVFLKAEDGSFHAHTVETGWRLNDRVQILSGLQEGDIVASGGTFLLNSEAAMAQPGAGNLTGAANSLPPVHRHGKIDP